MKRNFVLTFIIAILFFLPLYSQKDLSEKIKRVEEFIISQMEVDRIPGLTVGILKGNTLWAKGFGYSDIENKIPMKENSSFRLASVTKPMTAVAILQLAEKGKLNLDDEVQKYVPYFPKKSYPVTIRYLLGHLGGIPHYKSYEELHIKTPKDTREAIEIFANYDLVAEPGTLYHYSSYGYNLLGAVIEGVSKMSYGKYMEENIWKPLGMNSTCMDSPDEIIPNRVKGYRILEGEIKNSEFVDMRSRFAGGGTRSTVVDLLKFVKGLKENKIISKESLDKMFTSMTTKGGELTGYGYGWFVRPINGHFLVYHTGSQQETRTFLVYLPRKDIAVSFACNLEGVNPSLYGFRVIQILLDEPFNLTPYSGDPVEEIILTGMMEVFNHGMSYYERFQKAFTEDKKELEEAFDFFNNLLERGLISRNLAEIREKVRKGIHPKTGQAYQKIGSFMAEALKKEFGEQKFNYYYKNGAIPFFADYIKISKEDKIPPRFRFKKDFEEMVIMWERDWTSTLNDSTRTLFIGAFSDHKEIGTVLKKTFHGAKIYPNFAPQFSEAIKKIYLNGKTPKALEMAKLFKELYPDSAISSLTLATAYLVSGQIETAKKYYKEAVKAKVHGSALEPNSLLNIAYELASYNMADQALKMMEIILEIYPQESLFYEAKADLLIMMAENYYKKALEKNPISESARKSLKKLKELEREREL